MRKLLTFILLTLYFLLFSVNTAKAEEDILILFDASTSMMYEIDNQPKYIQMVDVIKKILSRTDSSKKIGLRIIGIPLNPSMVSYIFSPQKMCRATELLNPIKSNNIDNIIVNLDSIFPLGLSPMTYSLATAITSDFSISANPKHIILITDGEEGCDQDPCQFIKEITSVRKDIKIDVIAINVTEDKAIHQLKCLAQYTGGEVKNANNPDQMDFAFLSVLSKFSSYSKFSQYTPSQRNIINYKNYMFETDK